MNNNRNMRRCAQSCGTAARAAASQDPQDGSGRRGGPAALLPVMAYVPVQELGDVYTECQALHAGTLFPALDKPFSGKGCRR